MSISAFLIAFIFLLSGVIGYLSFRLYSQKKIYQKSLDERYKTLLSFRRIYQVILEDLEFDTVIQRIANIIPHELSFGTGVLAIIDQKRGVIKRIAASQTPEAQNAIKALRVPFDKIEIPIDDQNNLMSKAVREKKPFITADAFDVFSPILTREESAKIQQIMGTKTTFVYPIMLEDKPMGVFLASTFKEYQQLGNYELEVIDNFVNLIGLAIKDASLFSEVKDTTQKLQIANEKLKQLDHLKDDFVSIASHELRTPMTAIRSYVWMALHKPDIVLSEKMKKYLNRTLISTERLINLVNDMLNVSRIEGGRIEISPKPFDMVILCRDVVEEVVVKAQERGVNVILTESNIPKVFADPEKVHEVLLNLIGNSLKFTPSGGSITISFFPDGQMLDILVKDTGVGITKDDLGRLFKKFSRLDNSYVAMATSGGTGLGLYISRSLVELMKGRIWATSEGVNKGTTFGFSLPIATETIIKDAEKFKTHAIGEAKGLEPVSI